jgi:hypothetical protein
MVNFAGVPVHLDCYLSVQARLDEECRCKVCTSQDNLCAGDISNSVGLTRREG